MWHITIPPNNTCSRASTPWIHTLEAVPHEVSKWVAPSGGKNCVPSTRIFAVNTHARIGSIASFPDTAPLRVAVNPRRG